MPSRGLPVDVDTSYPDDATHPDVVLHQRHHDLIHEFVNMFDDGAPPDGSIFFYNLGTGLFVAIDPSIAGSPGPPGDDGVSFRVLGTWNSGTAYVNNASYIDVIRYGGATYACLTSNTNSAPPNANWQVLALDGADGADGTNGTQGPPGADSTVPGPQGIPGPTVETLVVAVSGSSYTIDAANASIFDLTLTASCAISITGPTLCAITVLLRQDGTGGHVATFSTPVAWQGGVDPALSVDPDRTDIVSLFHVSGSWYGTAVIDFETPAVAAPTLDALVIASLASGTDGTTWSLSPNGGSAGDPITGVQDGDLLLLGIENMRGTSLDTDVPVPTGLVAAWDLLDVTNGTIQYYSGTTRMRLSVFGYKVTTAPTAAPVTITVPNLHLGCSAILVRIPGTPSTGLATAKAKVVKNSSSSSPITATLAAAGDAANRPIAFAVVNTVAPTLSPNATGPWIELLEVGHTTPTAALAVSWRPDAFATAVSSAFLNSPQVAGTIATELVQG